LRVLHRLGQDMGITEDVVCRVEVLDQDGVVLDKAWAGKLGKEHRLRGSVPGDGVDVTVTAHHEPDVDGELTATRTVVLTGDLDDVIRFGVGSGWDRVAAVDAGELPVNRRPRHRPTGAQGCDCEGLGRSDSEPMPAVIGVGPCRLEWPVYLTAGRRGQPTGERDRLAGNDR
jgi:hypothetical protein